MQSGRNPTRRNRNIGTSKQGYGQDNLQRIAESRSKHGPTPCYFERLESFDDVAITIGRCEIRLIVEHTRDDAVHAVTIDDLARVMGWLPSADITGIGTLLLRQPKRREEMLRPVWGRVVFDGIMPNYRGPVLMLEAITLGSVWKWSHHLKPDDHRELQRYRDLGFDIRQTKRDFEIHPTLNAARAMQLHHTVPHEIGHWVQYRSLGPECFEQTPHQEREDFAHRYADKFRNEARAIGHLPFERLISEARLNRHGLRSADFIL